MCSYAFKRSLLLVVVSASIWLGHSLAYGENQPNVVFIITDDQGYGDLSCHGNPVLKTPSLDALHSQSVRLTDYHVSPTCSPTRGALHSGHSANRAGTWSTTMGRSLLREGEMTLGQIFQDNGYKTGMFGKWHLGDNYPFRAEDRGFDEVVRHGGGGVGQTPDFWDNAYFNDTYFHNGSPKKFKGFCTDVFFNEAKRFIEEVKNNDQPFFAYISTNAPHSPWHCPDKYWKPLLNHGISEQQAIFLGMVANIDENIGKLRDWLGEVGLAENTLFIFTTDNGTAAGEQIFNAGMRGKKTSAYDGGHRVPFFLHWPAGGLNVSKDIETLTAHIDILPTLIDICGLKNPPVYEFEGRSLAPLLYELPVPWPERVIITDSQRVTTPIKWRGSAVMTERWRLVRNEELFDIQEDPGQEHNVIQQFPEVASWLRDEYETWWSGIEPGFSEYARIRVGNDAENPVKLTSHDWINNNRGIPWNQAYVRTAYHQPGFWAVKVEESGWYEIELRRWPEELDRAIVKGLKPGSPVPGLKAMRENPGKALPVRSATLSIADVKEEKQVKSTDKYVRFRVNISAGDHELSCLFHLDTDDEDYKTVGAYYVSFRKL